MISLKYSQSEDSQANGVDPNIHSVLSPVNLDPFLKARQFYHGESLEEFKRIKEVLERLDPRKNIEEWKKTKSRKPLYDPNEDGA